MPKSAVESTLAKVLYSIFSFLLSMLSLFLVLLIILQATFLNRNYILNIFEQMIKESFICFLFELVLFDFSYVGRELLL